MLDKIEYRVVEKLDGHGRLLKRTWHSMHSNAAHRQGAPASEEYDPETGKLVALFWIDQKNHGRHREGCLPSFVQIDPVTDVVYNEEYYESGIQHRDDGGPTKILRNRTNGLVVEQKFHIDGMLHRDYDLPAVMEFHPETGLPTRFKYHHRDQLHRLNGPAIVEFDEDGNMTFCQYFRHGQEQTSNPMAPNLNR